MPRRSGYRGTWEPNRRPYVTLTPDCYVAIQGETSVIGCGECKRKVDVNRYLTSVATEASVDSPPGSATINLSIPDNHINDFYANDQFIIIPMMEIEVYAKGYYTIGGFPQYYKIFWGLVNTVSQNWSGGVTSITLNCKDILRWWELTSVIINPAFLDIGKSGSGYNLFQNKFSGTNPYAVILSLAREAMGDFSITQGSFTSFRPEDGPERGIITSYARNVMLYWQLKFGKIWNNLVLYGSSGTAYSFAGSGGNVSPLKIYNKIFDRESKLLDRNEETEKFRIQPSEIAAFKRDFSKAGDVDFFQNESQTKLQLALTARDQAGAYEFYCDTTGDIVFKPPFYNLNTMPNKPVSWIQDFEIIDESISESEQDVFTHVTSSGNAFGGVNDYGLSDEITTPRTGVIDWHLVRRYGWRRLNLQLEWAGNPRKLFYHCLDHMDKINAKRVRGSMTIPMRPELRMGFPVWIPKHDSFFYVTGIAHNFSPGGQATTQITLSAKRSKFIAPKNIGRIERNLRPQPSEEDLLVKKSRFLTQRQREEARKAAVKAKLDAYKGKVDRSSHHYKIEFPSSVGGTSGLQKPQGDPKALDKSSTNVDGQKAKQSVEEEGARFDSPAILRNIKTGKILGFPNVVMVYRTSVNREVIAQFLSQSGDSKGSRGRKAKQKQPTSTYDLTIRSAMKLIEQGKRSDIIDRLRLQRYETGMTNAGAYDYAHDVSGDFKELSVVPTDFISWKPQDGQNSGTDSKAAKRELAQSYRNQILEKEDELAKRRVELRDKLKEVEAAKKKQEQKQKAGEEQSSVEQIKDNAAIQIKQDEADSIKSLIDDLQTELNTLRAKLGLTRRLQALNILIRPVSDEYGFEVIGHYRYGRGAFVERGQIQTVDSNKQTINQLDIQFSPVGGLLTEGLQLKTLGPESHTFAESYERMMPNDFVTGASFKGDNYGADFPLEGVQAVTEATYYKSISDTRNTRTEQPIFVESDALRRAETLAELKPTLNTLQVGTGATARDVFTNCSCGMARTSWISVLPADLIRKAMQIIPPSPQQDATSDRRQSPAVEDGTPPTAEDLFRNYMVRVAVAQAGKNYKDTPEEMYDLIASPGDRDPNSFGGGRKGAGSVAWMKNWFSKPFLYKDKDSGPSTCGLTTRGILRAAGLNPRYAPEFYGPYIDNTRIDDPDRPGKKKTKRPSGMAVQDCIDLGKKYNAWVEGNNKNVVPKRGDMVVVGGWVDANKRVEHIFTVVSDVKVDQSSLGNSFQGQTESFDGVDGGMAVWDPSRKDPNPKKNLLQAVELVPRNGGLIWSQAPGNGAGMRWMDRGRHLQGWIDMYKLKEAAGDMFLGGGATDFSEPVGDADPGTGKDPYGLEEATQAYPITGEGVEVGQGNGRLFSLEPDGFLEILHGYLRQRFQQEYQANAEREQFAIYGGTDLTRQEIPVQDNVLTPKNTLFDRASQGDPDALDALKNGINFNFGQSEKALEEFKDQFNEGGKIDQLSDALSDKVEKMFDPETGDLVDAVEMLTGIPLEKPTTSGPGETEETTGSTSSASTGSSSPSQQAQEEKQKPGPSTTVSKSFTLPKSLQTGQHQPSTQPMTLPIPLNLEPKT